MSGAPYRIRKPDVARLEDYPALLRRIEGLPPEKKVAVLRRLALTDLYFLGRYVLKRADAEGAWWFDRCREVQADPNGRLDLWARGHGKSSIVTNWLTIQDILNDPELTIGIFSHTRPIAKQFLRQIKREFEGNEWLKALFPEVLWADPKKEAPKWSEDEGIIVKRRGNPKEATIEASGLVDGQPTSKHYGLLLYDDVVTRESVTTPEMIAKVTEAWALSTNLGGGGALRRFVGTRYHQNDTYAAIIKRGAARPRVYPCTKDGSVHGEPVLLSRAEIDDKRRDMGPAVFGAQMLLNPIADAVDGFQTEWLRHYERIDPTGMLTVLLVDPASSKKQGSDYTAAWVLGLHHDRNVYVLDGVRDRLNLSQRWALLGELHRKWRPRSVGYERYGKDADIEHFRAMMEAEHYRFQIQEVGGSMPKADRIRRLIPYFEQGRVWLPNRLIKSDYEGTRYNLTELFVEHEFEAFPICVHDDMLDAMARLFDLFPGGLPFPSEKPRAAQYRPPEHLREDWRPYT